MWTYIIKINTFKLIIFLFKINRKASFFDIINIFFFKRFSNFFKKIGICNLDDEFVLTYIFSNINIVIEKRKKSKKFNIDYEVEKRKGIYYFDNIYYRTVEFYQFQYLSLIDDYIKIKEIINNC